MENIYTDDNVIELVKKDFIIKKNNIQLKSTITNKLNGILIIYAPWCETCQISKRMWENLASLFRYKFNIYALNSYNFNDKNQDLTIPLDIRSYPSYKFISKSGDIKNCKYTNNKNEIIKFIIKNMN